MVATNGQLARFIFAFSWGGNNKFFEKLTVVPHMAAKVLLCREIRKTSAE
jgi:hypothetical protein